MSTTSTTHLRADLPERQRTYARMCVAATLAAAALVAVSVLIGNGPQREAEITAGILAMVSFGAGAWLSLTGRLGVATAITSLSVTVLAGGLELYLGHYTNNLWLTIGSILLVSFDTSTRRIWAVFALNAVYIASLPWLMPTFSLGPPGQPGLVPTVIVLHFGATLVMVLQVKAQNRAQAELVLKNIELEEARREAELASEAKTQFVASVSHEFRTPLNAIIGYAEILEEDLDTSADPGVLEDLGRIHMASEHLVSLINDILDISKIEAGHMEPDPERFALGELLDDVRGASRPLVEAGFNTLEVRAVGLEAHELSQDRLRMQQILLNLLSNAAKFTERGTITLIATLDDDWLELSVEDTGVGMTEETLSKVFDPYVQGERGPKLGTTGLGLPLCDKLAGVLGGTLSATSTPGEGSAFTLRVPAELG